MIKKNLVKMFECFMTLFRVYKVYIFLSFNILFGQFSSNVVHVDIISESEKVEASIIFDKIIDRDDVSGWIDRENYFTLSLFNVSLEKNNFSKFYQSGALSIEIISNGKKLITNSGYFTDKQNKLNKYSKSFLIHLIKSNEMMASMLISLHNIYFYQQFMREIRKNIKVGTFDLFYRKYINFFD